MAAMQKPISGSALAASVPQEAWKTIPAWYLGESRALHSPPGEVARFIEEAARAAVK